MVAYWVWFSMISTVNVRDIFYSKQIAMIKLKVAMQFLTFCDVMERYVICCDVMCASKQKCQVSTWTMSNSLKYVTNIDVTLYQFTVCQHFYTVVGNNLIYLKHSAARCILNISFIYQTKYVLDLKSNQKWIRKLYRYKNSKYEIRTVRP